jgi:hypothetical protein
MQDEEDRQEVAAALLSLSHDWYGGDRTAVNIQGKFNVSLVPVLIFLQRR